MDSYLSQFKEIIDEHFEFDESDVTDKLQRLIKEMWDEGDDITWEAVKYFIEKHEEQVI